MVAALLDLGARYFAVCTAYLSMGVCNGFPEEAILTYEPSAKWYDIASYTHRLYPMYPHEIMDGTQEQIYKSTRKVSKAHSFNASEAPSRKQSKYPSLSDAQSISSTKGRPNGASEGGGTSPLLS